MSYHVVRHAVKGVTCTYAIYLDNEPFLVPAGAAQKLGKREAYLIAGLLNESVK